MLCLISMTTNDSIDWCVVFTATTARILSTKHATRICIIKLGVKNAKRKLIFRAQFWIRSTPLQCPQFIPGTAFYTCIIIYFSVFPVCKGLRSFCPKFFLNFLSLSFELHIWNVSDSAIFRLRFCYFTTKMIVGDLYKLKNLLLRNFKKFLFFPCLLPITPKYFLQNFLSMLAGENDPLNDGPLVWYRSSLLSLNKIPVFLDVMSCCFVGKY